MNTGAVANTLVEDHASSTPRGRSAAATGPLWARLATWQVIGYLYVVVGFLLLAIVVVPVGLLIIGRGATVSLSAFQFVLPATPWVTFAVAIHFVTDWMGPHVAAGATRRSFLRASVAAALAVAVIGGVALTCLVRLEGWSYGLLGWTAGTLNQRPPLADAPVAAVTWGFFVLLGASTLTGLIVGLAYRRLGAAATLLLPLTLSPLLATMVVALHPLQMFTPINGTINDNIVIPLDGIPVGMTVALGLAILVAAAATAILLGRRLPMTPRRG